MHMHTVFALLTASAVQLVAAGGFSSTCSGMKYSSTTLTADCKNNVIDSYFENHPINLADCLANLEAGLSPSFKFCDCGLAGDHKTLDCRCTDSTGTKRPSSVNLGQEHEVVHDAIVNVCLAHRVEVDVTAEQHGTMKLPVFGRVYANILARPDVKGCHVRAESESDVDNLRAQKREA
ncbi:hypothetical protein CSAL01_07321 [Colletotrichum salicis]|uniref:Cyanovirin-N domain-containing protein n=1 Tax=Colletotrichum salicis TaxID=1209931 RepID=A0A135TIE8_9PEZI|nr:hypothetical protein CSAL01_07321 [Colletotrichum salicis]